MKLGRQCFHYGESIVVKGLDDHVKICRKRIQEIRFTCIERVFIYDIQSRLVLRVANFIDLII